MLEFVDSKVILKLCLFCLTILSAVKPIEPVDPKIAIFIILINYKLMH